MLSGLIGHFPGRMIHLSFFGNCILCRYEEYAIIFQGFVCKRKPFMQPSPQLFPYFRLGERSLHDFERRSVRTESCATRSTNHKGKQSTLLRPLTLERIFCHVTIYHINLDI